MKDSISFEIYNQIAKENIYQKPVFSYRRALAIKNNYLLHTSHAAALYHFITIRQYINGKLIDDNYSDPVITQKGYGINKPVNYAGKAYTAEQVKHMRVWLLESSIDENLNINAQRAGAVAICKEIDSCYEGGIKQFFLDNYRAFDIEDMQAFGRVAAIVSNIVTHPLLSIGWEKDKILEYIQKITWLFYDEINFSEPIDSKHIADMTDKYIAWDFGNSWDYRKTSESHD